MGAQRVASEEVPTMKPRREVERHKAEEAQQRPPTQAPPALTPCKLPHEERAPDPAAAIALLDSWLEQGDAEEQRETWELLRKALDDDRLSYRKFFMP
jgi:hypothetical protein